MQKIVLPCVLLLLVLAACQKQSGFNGGNQLYLSEDSVHFDTLFSSTASVTHKIKLINNNDQAIQIASIRLAGGTGSSFVININGSPGPEASNVTVDAHDSLYVFVNAFVRQSTQPLPFILEDSILISYQAIEQKIKLSVWGQNAHFLTNQIIHGNISWPNDLPYVIYGGLTVDSSSVLTIATGTHIYMHAGAAIFINGTLKVLGDTQRVFFSGDRLDQPYVNYPGAWPGIYFGESSHDNVLIYAVLRNAYHGIVAQGSSGNTFPKLILQQCIVDNSLDEGILAVGTSIDASNCLISNCGENIVIGLGGDYTFTFCTVASYNTTLVSHQKPVLQISNAATDGGQTITATLYARFENCIFWGSDNIPDEAAVTQSGNTAFSVLLEHSILKQFNYPVNIDSNVLLLNTDPVFNSTGQGNSRFDFHLQSGSPALDAGETTGILVDLDGSVRPAIKPDLGSYERQ